VRTIRRFLRRLIIRLFGGVGETILLPRIRNIYDQLPLYDWRTKKYCANEARRIQSAISNNVTQFTIVFDCQTVLSYGAILNMLTIARYLTSHEKFVNFIVVDTEFQHAQENENLDKEKMSERINDLVVISKALLDPKMSSVSLISPTTLLDEIDSLSKSYILFDDFTRDRRPFFRDCFNVFNVLMSELSPVTQNRILFSVRDFEKYIPKSFEINPYVTWQCRYSSRGVDFGRQTLRDEFLKSYTYLRTRFPGHQVMIISDVDGCEHYSTLAKDLDIADLVFSKDYSSDFLGDAALLLNSDFFFFFRGGGIGLFAIHSRIPYEYFSPIMNDMMWDKKKFASWQGESQRFVLLDKHQFVEDRSLDLEKIGFSSTGSS